MSWDATKSFINKRLSLISKEPSFPTLLSEKATMATYEYALEEPITPLQEYKDIKYKRASPSSESVRSAGSSLTVVPLPQNLRQPQQGRRSRLAQWMRLQRKKRAFWPTIPERRSSKFYRASKTTSASSSKTMVQTDFSHMLHNPNSPSMEDLNQHLQFLKADNKLDLSLWQPFVSTEFKSTTQLQRNNSNASLLNRASSLKVKVTEVATGFFKSLAKRPTEREMSFDWKDPLAIDFIHHPFEEEAQDAIDRVALKWKQGSMSSRSPGRKRMRTMSRPRNQAGKISIKSFHKKADRVDKVMFARAI